MKIKVLLIDDNPEYAFCNKKLIPELPESVLNESSIREIPWVSSQNHSEDIVLFQNMKGVEGLFELKWLQFHTDVFEFRNMSNEVKSNHGLNKLNLVGFVPDLIVFDYALTDTKQETASEYLNYLTNYNINEFINPNVTLANFLEKHSERKSLPRDNNYLDSSPEFTQDANFDSYGLYCGCLISEMFKYEKPVASIPVTRKDKDKISSEPDAAFFEWMINDSYRKIFDRNKRTFKDWNSILKDGLFILRIEILNMILINKIGIDFKNLESLYNGDFLNIIDNKRQTKYLNYQSAYGMNSLPLDGLFMDCDNKKTEIVPDELKDKTIDDTISKRDLEIWDFSKKLLKNFIASAELNFDINEIVNAKTIAESLWIEYINNFEERIYLSDYACRKIKNILDDDDLKKLNNLCEKFGVENGKIANEKSIESFKGESPVVIRLTILYLATFAHIQMERIYKVNSKLNYYKLSEEEFFYILNPSANSGNEYNLILPMHIPNDTEAGKAMAKFKTNTSNRLTKTSPKITKSNVLDFEKWISEGEKIILKSMFFNDENYFPEWLR